MVEPVGITLASVGLFLQIFDTCDRLYHGVKLTWRFGDDYDAMQIEFEMQWARFDSLLRTRRVSQNQIDANRSVISRYLEQMRKYFAECNKLMKWYDKEGYCSHIKSFG